MQQKTQFPLTLYKQKLAYNIWVIEGLLVGIIIDNVLFPCVTFYLTLNWLYVLCPQNHDTDFWFSYPSWVRETRMVLAARQFLSPFTTLYSFQTIDTMSWDSQNK